MISRKLIPLIVSAALTAGGVAAAAPASASRVPVDASAAGERPVNSQKAVATVRKEVLSIVNQERANRGLEPLKLGRCLSGKVATPWATEMAETGNFEHQDLGVIFERCTAAGFGTAGENIAAGYGSAAEVMEGWMNSSGHRENILNPAFTRLGVGVTAASDGTLYWVQNFAG
jgi:uncharacterized protein YkwD